MPKVGEYWHLSIPLRVIDLDSSKEFHENRAIVAKCVSVTDRGPVFYGNALFSLRNVYYGSGFYECKIVGKWEPNWFWKLLGYK